MGATKGCEDEETVELKIPQVHRVAVARTWQVRVIFHRELGSNYWN